ncbi:MAG: nitrilase-related carbon-nitrogen hydrolase [Candidatus Bathyarchaeota archaeon]
MAEPYRAVVIQSDVELVDLSHSEELVKETMSKNLTRICQLIDWASREKSHGEHLLVALPESMLHGFPRAGWSLSELLKACITIPGPETDRLSEQAVKYGMYIVGHSWEVHKDWPGRHFSTAFIINDTGEVILKYRKIQPAFDIEASTSPHDVLDEYIGRYGVDSLFPVVETPLGRLGCFICYDGLFPEVTRCLALKGAEVLIRPTSWLGVTCAEPYDWWEMQNRQRAAENICYVIAPNAGDTINSPERPRAHVPGRSMIVDYEGRLMAKAGTSGELTIDATIHLDALWHKRKLHQWNPLATLRTEAYAPFYQQSCYPPNLWKDKPHDSLKQITDAILGSIQKLKDRGIIRTKK